jgi:hypothetical protein
VYTRGNTEGRYELNETEVEWNVSLEMNIGAKEVDHPTAGWPQQSEVHARGDGMEEGW